MNDFWSKRKAAVAAEEEAPAVVEAAAPAAEDDRPDAEILEELDLPIPEEVTTGEEARAFLQQAVPERLRRRALRQLWKVNPVLANLDGLVDYGEDFTDAATVVENLSTAYQVGKGMLKHVEALAAAKEAEVAEEDMADLEAEVDADADVAQAEEDTIVGDETVDVETDTGFGDEGQAAQVAEHTVDAANAPSEEPLAAGPTVRRMAFRFDAQEVL